MCCSTSCCRGVQLGNPAVSMSRVETAMRATRSHLTPDERTPVKVVAESTNGPTVHLIAPLFCRLPSSKLISGDVV